MDQRWINWTCWFWLKSDITELEQATLLSNGEYFPYRNSDLFQIFEVIAFTSEY